VASACRLNKENPMSELPNDLIKPGEAARLLDMHCASIYRMIQAGKLRAWRKASCHLLVSKADVLNLIQPVRPVAPIPHETPSREAKAKAQRDAFTDRILRNAGLR
jgi:excisionase family DNA binding protein